MLRLMFCLAACLALGGCVTESVMKSTMPAGPVAWQDGYLPGCESGANAAGDLGFKFSKDFQRYLSDAMYKEGWDDGFKVCNSQFARDRPK
jgi:hypothetical protein